MRGHAQRVPVRETGSSGCVRKEHGVQVSVLLGVWFDVRCCIWCSAHSTRPRVMLIVDLNPCGAQAQDQPRQLHVDQARVSDPLAMHNGGLPALSSKW